MENLIDHVVSETWLFMTVVIGALLLAGFFFMYKPFRNNLIDRAIGTVFVLISIYVMIYLTRSEYGYAAEFIEMRSNGNEVCLMERHETGDGDGGTYTMYRIYVLDLKTGKRLLRMTCDYSEILTMTDNGVFIFEPDRVVRYDLFTGKETGEWSAENGFKKFPELKSGINSLGRNSRIIQGRKKGYLSITAMDGHQFYFDPEDEKLYPGTLPNEPYDPRTYMFNFSVNTGEIKTLMLSNTDRAYDGEFLSPEIMLRDDSAEFIIVEHYAALDKRDAILTAISFDLKKIWEVKQSSLGITDKYNENPELGSWLYEGNNLLLSFGGAVLCLDAKTGKEIWRNRL
ncbi:MAG TPA: hypothetical protein VGK59_22470 [Ohtaekwangia sp.]